MSTRLYLDTARLGLMCRSAQEMQLDFVQFAGEEAGTLYLEQFLKDGFLSWPLHLQARFPRLCHWRGIQSFQMDLIRLADGLPGSRVLIANRAAELMKLGSQLLFQQCRNVLTTDLSWPNYQRILEREATRLGCNVTRVNVRRDLLQRQMSSQSLIDKLTSSFAKHHCDGLFLPMVDNLGIRLPVDEIVYRLRDQCEVRFVLVDGAQAMAHVPLSLSDNYCDLLIAGCHKWLRAYNPLGMAFYGHPSSKGWIDDSVESSISHGEIDDPLLRFTREMQNGPLSRYGETVNLLPMFTCQAAIAELIEAHRDGERSHEEQLLNANRIFQLGHESDWKPLRPAETLRSGVVLLQADNSIVRQTTPQHLRQVFHDLGLSLTTYQNGIVRVSTPWTPWSNQEELLLADALRTVGDGSMERRLFERRRSEDMTQSTFCPQPPSNATRSPDESVTRPALVQSPLLAERSST